MRILRSLLVLIGLIAIWQAVVWLTEAPFFILPSPARVAQTLVERFDVIWPHAQITALEIVLGIVCGAFVGTLSALIMAYFAPARRWLLPVFVISQAIPVFALAPLLVLWLGYGLVSKVAMATLIIYFPVTSSFFDGLRRTETGYLDLARTMNASRWTALTRIRIPATLPAFASGLRVAAAVAPIGAVIGEWVGSSAGLGYLMLHANGRMQIDLLFAALAMLAALAITLYFAIDIALKRALYWMPDTNPSSD